MLSASERLGLLHELVALPLGVGSNFLLSFVLSLLCRTGLCLTGHQISVRCKELHTVAFEIRKPLELMFLHKCEKLLLHLTNDRIPKFHHARADLHRITAEQNELRCIVASLNAADTAERPARKFSLDHLGDFHAHSQRDRHY